jgi:tripartite-type tricarboxylate transporter receptor subunit TctC
MTKFFDFSRRSIRVALAALVGLTVMGVPAFLHAQGYPNKPIRVIVPAGPGDSCDLLMRLIGPKISEKTGQSWVVENRPGSSGQLGLNLIKQAPPDGYTLGCGQGGNMVIVPIAYEKVSYETTKDFAPIALIGSNFLALVVNADVPFKTTEELIAFAKANPGKVSFGTNGEGGFLHFATELFRVQGGFNYLHVPYKSVSAAITEILGGQINASLTSFIAVQPYISSGRLRVLGIARASRSSEYPNIPTLSEAVPGFTSGGWFGLIAPAGTPKEIVNMMNREVNLALTSPDVRQKMKAFGLEVHVESPEFFSETIRTDFIKWGRLAKDIKFKPI